MDWSRRDFLKFSSVSLVGSAFPTSAPFAQQAGGEFQELRRHVGIFSARGGTIGWLINPEGVVVVDSQFPDTAEACLEGLKQRTERSLDALINTHHHGDHTAGNGVFRPAARKIVAHVRVPELQRRAAQQGGTEDRQTYADTTFEESWQLEVGDEKVRARHYGPAHTGGDATIFFEQTNVVHMGDLVFNRVFPFIDRPGGASIRGWIELLEAVSGEHSADTQYVFGHGKPGFGVTGSRADLLFQRDFFNALLETTQRAIREGKSREDATKLEALPGFPDHVAPVERINLPGALGVAYDELTSEG